MIFVILNAYASSQKPVFDLLSRLENGGLLLTLTLLNTSLNMGVQKDKIKDVTVEFQGLFMLCWFSANCS